MGRLGGRLASFVAATGLLVAAGARADRPKPKPVPPPAVSAGIVVDRPGAERQAVASIDDRIHDIELLRSQAARDGQGIKLSCIDEKLRKAKQAREEAAQLVGDISQSGFDQVLLRGVYAIVYAEEARACADLKPVGPGGVLPTNKTGPTLPDDPNPITDIPVVVRPPLASIY